MKKMLWLAAFAMAAAPMLEAGRMGCAGGSCSVETRALGDQTTGLDASDAPCNFRKGPCVGGETLQGPLLEGCTIPGETFKCPDVKCPDMQCPCLTCPVNQCPDIPVCRKVRVETRLVEDCPAGGCEVKQPCKKRCVKRTHCHHCHKHVNNCRRGCKGYASHMEYNRLVDENQEAAAAHPLKVEAEVNAEVAAPMASGAEVK